MSAVSLEVLVGGPLAALVNAQAIAARTTADFISDVGFEPSPPYPVRKFAFEFDRMVEGIYYPGQFTRQTVSAEVPLLAITPIPFIRIGEATIDIEVKVVGPPKLEERPKAIRLTKEPDLVKRVKIVGLYTYQKPVREPTDLSATIKIHIKVVQEPLPEGLARTLTMLHDSLMTTVGES